MKKLERFLRAVFWLPILLAAFVAVAFMDPKSLRRLDFVLGSFHSALRTRDDQTERYLAALRNLDIQVLGHPRGRIYNYRLGLKADWPRVFAAATKLDKALEIDSYPDRQDLNVSLLKLARKAGCRISLGTDAHHPWQLEFIELGLAAALKAKIPAERIVNFMSLGDLRRWGGKSKKRFPPRVASCRAAGCVSSPVVHSLESSSEASSSRSLYAVRATETRAIDPAV